MSTDRGMDKEDMVHCIYGGILLSYEKGWNDAVCGYMGGRRDTHTKSVRKAHIKWYHLEAESKI